MNTLVLDRFFAKIEKTNTCWLWTGSLDGAGYGMFRTGPGRVRRAHRISWEIENGPVRDGTLFLHACDNPPCVNPAHVRPGTHAENAADRDAKGRHRTPRGVEHHAAILTAEQVAAIRAAPSAAGVCKALAREYGVALGTIYGLRSRTSRTWKDVA